jgi:hypothetical protein
MLLSSLLALLLVPLTSHLLTVGSAVTYSSELFNIPNTYNTRKEAYVDLEPHLQTARMLLINNFTSPAWTSTSYAFEPITLENKTGAWNLTINGNAYQSKLDCAVVNPTLTVGNLSPVLDEPVVKIDFTDRGCHIFEMQLLFNGQANASVFGMTALWDACGEWPHNARMVIAMGNPTSDTTIANLTTVSCIPSYWGTSGNLHVHVVDDSSLVVNSFDEDTSKRRDMSDYESIVYQNHIGSYRVFDPGYGLGFDIFSRIIYDLATSRKPATPLDPETIVEAAQEVWLSVFAQFTSNNLIDQPSPRSVVGQISKLETRLFVVSYIAWAMVGVMALVALCNALLIWNAETNTSILYEEPKGLLGAAVLLRGSNITSIVEKKLQQKVLPGQTSRDYFEKEHKMAGFDCWYDKETGRIRLEWNLGADVENLNDSTTPTIMATPSIMAIEDNVNPVDRTEEPLIGPTSGEHSRSISPFRGGGEWVHQLPLQSQLPLQTPSTHVRRKPVARHSAGDVSPLIDGSYTDEHEQNDYLSPNIRAVGQHPYRDYSTG